jgi:hypothetical protein
VRHSCGRGVTVCSIVVLAALHGSAEAAGKRWPKRYSEVALAKDQLPKVVESHPRLWVRAEPWAYGLSVAG